ncbi:MAG: HIT domain-containing protein [Actinobacteria bacterium]|nr:HIT domain-containing protein [Actinomycetota bacterium]
MTKADCVFCAIVDGRLPAAKVREDEMTLALIANEPATNGHTLVIPKRHARNLFDIAVPDLHAVIVAAKAIAKLQRDRLHCDGVSLYQANEEAGFQTVFHLHLHVVPRYRGDTVVRAWRANPVALTELEAIARRLREPL